MAAEVIERLFQALAARDMATANRLLADDLTFSLGGTSRFAGRHIGRENALTLLGELTETLGITNTVHGIYDGHDGAVIHQTGEVAGYSDESLILFRVKDGQVREIIEFLYDPTAFDAFVAKHDQQVP
jgi:ketosteroid isomerase-like protein